MEKYLEVKPESKLYIDYFGYIRDNDKVLEAVRKVREEFGIETERFYRRKNTLRVEPTEVDEIKFSNMLKKTSTGEFKKTSAPYKLWRSLLKDIEHFNKPRLFYYMECPVGKWKERLFHIDKRLYCSIASENEIETPEWGIEMKASSFYKIVERIQEEENAECSEGC